MMRSACYLVSFFLLSPVLLGHGGLAYAEAPTQVKVYYEAGRFGGWPANHGIWAWENEILVGFSRAWYKDQGKHHHVDHDKPEEHCLARSLDGGMTWTIENPAEKGYLIPEGDSLHGSELDGVEIKPTLPCPGGINFTHPDFAMTLRMNSVHNGQSRFYYSYDRGHVWEGPFLIPNFGTQGTAARTCYLVEGKDSCTIFITVAKKNGKEGRPLCARTEDGGKTWTFLSYIGPEYRGFTIMPAAVRLGEKELYVVLRHRDRRQRWLSAWRSMDNGLSWTEEAKPVSDTGSGNPPSLIKLKDGRLALSYGVRKEPFRMEAKLSEDGGRSWSDPIILRQDGASGDMGYPRSVQRSDGKVVTTYYFNDAATGPERYIGATIWNPMEQ